MRQRVFFLLAVLTAAAACGPVNTFYREGVPVSKLNADTTECRVNALRDAPVANQVRQRPPVFIPGQRYCNAAGQCYTRPGYWVDGGFYTVDVNQGLRDQVMTQCMAQRGYAPVSIKRCPQSVSAAPASANATLPPLTEQSCAIVNQDGSWRVVTPGAPG